jgi:hypothetical protein
MDLISARVNGQNVLDGTGFDDKDCGLEQEKRNKKEEEEAVQRLFVGEILVRFRELYVSWHLPCRPQ